MTRQLSHFAVLAVIAAMLTAGCGKKKEEPEKKDDKPAAKKDDQPSAKKDDQPKQDPPGKKGAPGDQPKDKPPTDGETGKKTQPQPGEGKMDLTRKPFGKTPDGNEVDLYTITNKNGLVLELTNFGATVVSMKTPDKVGNLADIQLGFDNLQGYIDHGAHFGCTVGRYGNRIAKGSFTLDGQTYQLATNNDENHLHGGEKGFDRVLWQAEPIRGENETGIQFTYVSPDEEEGYPGELTTVVTYSLTNHDELKITYQATTDKPTVVNLTNHCYWNLGGAGSGQVLDHELMIAADKYLAVDKGLIPTGDLEPVAGTPLDFTAAKAIGKDIDQLKAIEHGPGGYDHCYVLRGQDGKLELAARAKDPDSGRVMEIYTTQPGIQFYTGNFLMGDPKDHGGYKQHEGFCLETQHYPDSPNQPAFPTTTLRPGERYHEVTVHRFLVEE